MLLTFSGLTLLSAAALGGVGVWSTNGPPEGVGRYVIADPMHVGTLYAGADTGIVPTGPYKSTDDGQTWARAGSLPLFGGRIVNSAKPLATASPSTVYFSGEQCLEAAPCSAGVYSSLDGGATWTQFLYGFIGPFVHYLMFVDPSTPTTIFLAESSYMGTPVASILKTADGGFTWVPTSSTLFDHSTISAMIGTTISGNLYVAGTPGGLFKTLDAGATWTALPSAPSSITALAADPSNPSTVYAGTSSGVFKSIDGAATFTQTNAGLTTTSVTSFAIDPVQPNHVYVGTGGGVFRSVDGGSTWQSLNNGLSDLNVYTLAIDGNGAFLHAGTSTGVFDYQFASSTCTIDSHTLCLKNGLFSVSAHFQARSGGQSSPATAVPLTSDTGYFWFFDPANVEMTVKVLDGCTGNGHYWVFGAGMTNIGVEWKVTNNLSGTSKNYSNPIGAPFQPEQDTSAFPCP